MSRYQGSRPLPTGPSGTGHRSNPVPSSAAAYRRRSRSPDSVSSRRNADRERAKLDRELDERARPMSGAANFRPRSVGRRERSDRRGSIGNDGSTRQADGGGPSGTSGVACDSNLDGKDDSAEAEYSSEEGMVTPPQKHALVQAQAFAVIAPSSVTRSPTSITPSSTLDNSVAAERYGYVGKMDEANCSSPILGKIDGPRDSTAALAQTAQEQPGRLGGFSTIQLGRSSSLSMRTPLSNVSAVEYARSAGSGVASANLLDPHQDEENVVVAQGRSESAVRRRGNGSRSPQSREHATEDMRDPRGRNAIRERDRDDGRSRDHRNSTTFNSRDVRRPRSRRSRSDEKRDAAHDRRRSSSPSRSRSSRSRSRTPPPRQPPSGPRNRDRDFDGGASGPGTGPRYLTQPRRDELDYRRGGTDQFGPNVPTGPSGGSWGSKGGGYGSSTKGRGGSERVHGGREEYIPRSGTIPSGPKFRVPPAEIRSRAEVDAERERARLASASASAATSAGFGSGPMDVDVQQRDTGVGSRVRARPIVPSGAMPKEVSQSRAPSAPPQDQSRREADTASPAVAVPSSEPNAFAPPPPPPASALPSPPPPPPLPSGPSSWASRKLANAAVAESPPMSRVTSGSSDSPIQPASHAARSEDAQARGRPSSIPAAHANASRHSPIPGGVTGRPIGGVASYPTRGIQLQHQSSASPGTPSTPREAGGDREQHRPSSAGQEVKQPVLPPLGPRKDSRTQAAASSPINPYAAPSTPLNRPRGESASAAAHTPGTVATSSRGSDNAVPQSVLRPQQPQQQAQQHRSRGISGWRAKPAPKEVERVVEKVETARFTDGKGKVVEFVGRPSATVGKETCGEWRHQLRDLQHQRDLLTHSFQPLAAALRDIKMKLGNNELYLSATEMKLDAAREIEYDKNMGYLSS